MSKLYQCIYTDGISDDATCSAESNEYAEFLIDRKGNKRPVDGFYMDTQVIHAFDYDKNEFFLQRNKVSRTLRIVVVLHADVGRDMNYLKAQVAIVKELIARLKKGQSKRFSGQFEAALKAISPYYNAKLDDDNVRIQLEFARKELANLEANKLLTADQLAKQSPADTIARSSTIYDAKP